MSEIVLVLSYTDGFGVKYPTKFQMRFNLEI